ncbi:MAG: hypothetical protein PVG65_00385 [Candidatus Thorarchaeota archaeon]|jgi:hypothetical protein
MIFTENINVSDSMLFVLSARSALSIIVENTGVEGKEELINFIESVASEYEILHMLVREDFPEVEHDEEDFQILFMELKEQILENFEYISEVIGIKETKTFLQEVGPISPINEIEGFKGVIPWAKKFGQEIWKSGKMLKAKNILKTQHGMTDYEAKRFIKKAMDIGMAKSGESAGKIASSGLQVKKLGLANYKYIAAKKKEALAGAKKVASKTGAQNAIKAYINKLGPLAKQAAIGLGAAVLVSLAIFGSYKVYKRFFSKAAKACRGLSGKDKSACMKKHKRDARMNQIKDLKASASFCSKSKDPAKCKAGISKKVAKLQKKLSK